MIGSFDVARAQSPLALRVDREVCTERDLFHCAGTFYELPAENAGGFSKIRPIATGDLLIVDYASYRGLLVLSGLTSDATNDSERVVRSQDGKCALWLGSVDDLWSLGRPRGEGCVWLRANVGEGEISDPMLATGFQNRRVSFENNADSASEITLELDATGNDDWREFETVTLGARETKEIEIPDAFPAYWARAVARRAGSVTVKFTYGYER